MTMRTWAMLVSLVMVLAGPVWADLAGAEVRFLPLDDGAPVPAVFHTDDPKQQFPRHRVTAEVWNATIAGYTGVLGKPSNGNLTATLSTGKRLWFKAQAETEDDLVGMHATLVALKPVPAAARAKRGDDWHYKMLEEYRAQGDLLALSDDSLTEMSFHIRYPAKEIYDDLLSVVAHSRFPLDRASDDGGIYQITTGYYTQDVGFMGRVFSGAQRVRAKMYAKIVADGPERCALNVQITSEWLQSGLFTGERWEEAPSPAMRDVIRICVTQAITMARYPGNYARVLADYQRGGNLPPAVRQAAAWAAEDFEPTGASTATEEPSPLPPPTSAEAAARAERARGFLQQSGELDKKLAILRARVGKVPFREAIGYAVVHGEEAQKILAELKSQPVETPAEKSVEAAIVGEDERIAALRAALEFEAQYGKGPAATKWEVVKQANLRYKQALQAGFRACSEAIRQGASEAEASSSESQ